MFDAWNIDPGYESDRQKVSAPKRVEVVETGPLRASVRVTTRWRSSTIQQDFALTDEQLANVVANVAGYPADKEPDGSLWYDKKKISSTTSTKMFCDIDTAGGQSGAELSEMLPHLSRVDAIKQMAVMNQKARTECLLQRHPSECHVEAVDLHFLDADTLLAA